MSSMREHEFQVLIQASALLIWIAHFFDSYLYVGRFGNQ
jgi:hypothetical protein